MNHTAERSIIRAEKSPGRSPREGKEEDISKMRIRFEDEMKQVESQMSRLRSEFEGGSPRHDPRQEPLGPVARIEPQGPRPQVNIPLIRDSSDERTFRLKFDVASYLPEEISVKTVDDKLYVKAKHEERGQGKNVYREFNQDFQLPPSVDPMSITSSLSVDGILSVEGPKQSARPAIDQRHH